MGVKLVAVYKSFFFNRLELVIVTFLSFFCQTINLRELALDEMMGGALEVKQEDILEKVRKRSYL